MTRHASFSPELNLFDTYRKHHRHHGRRQWTQESQVGCLTLKHPPFSKPTPFRPLPPLTSPLPPPTPPPSTHLLTILPPSAPPPTSRGNDRQKEEAMHAWTLFCTYSPQVLGARTILFTCREMRPCVSGQARVGPKAVAGTTSL